MNQIRSSLAVVALSIATSGSVALALDPLGSPKAGPAAGQFEIGADLLYGAADVETQDKYFNLVSVDGVLQPNQSVYGRTWARCGNQPMSKLYANLGYGISQNWEAFLRLGGADYGPSYDPSFTVGGGTKVTFCHIANWSFGGILQASWTGWEDDYASYYGTGTSEVSVLEAQIALGACCQICPQFGLYGGPFITFLDWESEGKGVSVSGSYVTFGKHSGETEVDGWFGGFLGLRVQLHEKATATLEGQCTTDAYAFAASIIYQFGQPR